MLLALVPSLGRIARRATLFSFAVITVGSGGMVADGWQAFGAAAEGERLVRMQRSQQWRDGHFENPQPLWNDWWGMVSGLTRASDHRSPAAAVPSIEVQANAFDLPPSSGLRVTWLGHSSMLLEIDGHRILTDPVWGPRASPYAWAGPQRWYAPPLALDRLPTLDAVVLSHDHYDHLDYPTIVALKDHDTVFVAPLGVGAHLEYWGVPHERIVELDWWETTRVGALDIACVPARHASGRLLWDKDATLWAGYAFVGVTHRVYFSGDTGLFPAMRDIGERFGPFDLTLIEAGAYNQSWPDWHLGPEQAVTAHAMVSGRVLLPIHWGLFNLAYHGWTEPIERVLAAADRNGTRVLTPKPGQSIEPAHAGMLERWWPADVPWVRDEDDPIRATKME